MKTLPNIVFLLCLFGAGAAAGKTAVSVGVSREVIGVVFLAANAFSAIAPSIIASSINKVDLTPPKELSRFYANKFKRQLEERRSVFWFRYYLVVVCAVISATIGGILRYSTPPDHMDWVVAVGTGTALIALTLSIFALVDFRILSNALREVADFADDLRRRNEFLDRPNEK